MDTKDRAAHGKFFNIKPEVGLLKSTARTFIQEGVTTEYATQVVGTTLDNGLYAQLLATTSRVLYEHDNAASKLPLQLHHNEIVADKDWQYGNNGLDISHPQFIKNTDYISPNNPFVVYPSRNHYDPVANRKAKEFDNFVLGSHIRHEPLPESQAQIQDPGSSEKNVTSAKVEEVISPKKVIPDSDLPTFTVSNVFAPSAFAIDDPNEINTERNILTTKAERLAKVLFRGGVPEQDMKHFSTVTYYGFADFTTVVGDTVIVFSPSTAAPSGGGHVTSISGEATIQEPVATKIKTFVSQNPKMATETIRGHNVVMQTTLPTFIVDPVTPGRDSKEMEDEEDYDTSTTPYGTSESTESSEEELQKKLNVLSREQDITRFDSTTPTIDDDEITTNEATTPKVFGVTPEQIQPSEVSIESKASLSKPSNEDILKLLASIKAKEAENKVEATTPLPQNVIQTGVTTVFFDDDPFAIQPTEVVTTGKATQQPDDNEDEDDLTTTVNPKSDLQKDGPVFNQNTSEQPIELTTEKIVVETTTEKERTTTQSIKETTLEPITEKPTTNLPEKPTTNLPETSSQIPSLENDDDFRLKVKLDLGCKHDVEIRPSTIYRTLTYLTTYFIPDDENNDITSTSVKSNAQVSTEIKYQSKCLDIEPTNVATESPVTKKVEELTTESSVKSTTSKTETTVEDEDSSEDISTEGTTEELTTASDEEDLTTLPADIKHTTEIITTKMHVTEEPEKPEKEVTTERPEPEEEDDEGEDYEDEEIDVIYKTLYTTYTYLTTFFVDSTSSISSRKEILTNVITQTLDPIANSDIVALINDMADKPTLIRPTKSGKLLIEPNTASDVGIGRPTTSFAIPESDLFGINQLLDEHQGIQSTPALDEKYLEEAGPKTLFTTYTYFTTVFVDGETEISSRTEVYTNIVNVDNVTPTVKAPIPDATEYVQKKDNDVLDPSSDYLEDSLKEKSALKLSKKDLENDNKIDNEIIHPKYVTMIRNPTSGEDKSDIEEILTMVTDVRSSSSHSERKLLERIDQESSESNTEEVLPAAQLLLQTSYTTFTYFTTLFNPSASSSKIESRLETLTNVVTETLNPTQTLQLNDDTAPITYFTTFTYWTTLYKDGSTTVTSREETISNVVNPTSSVQEPPETSSVEKIEATSIVSPVVELQTATILPSTSSNSDAEEKKDETSSILTSSLEPTTYYTTYTYYTTSYVGDETVLNSRFDTVTNVITPTLPTVKPTSRAIDLGNRNNLIDGDQKIKTIQPAYVFPSGTDQTESAAKVVPLLPETDPLKPTGILYLNEGKIVDADGISSILYTTKTLGTFIDNSYTQVVESSSKVQIDEIKKALKPSDADSVPGNRKTGLVRQYDGTIVANRTTTYYQSKVIGTYIDDKYAQIIESTSSYVIEKTIEPSNINSLNIQPTATAGQVGASTAVISPTPAVISSSISDIQEHDDSENEDNDEDDDEDGSAKGKSRLSYTPKKPSFTPAIRPFASRPRPTFNPAKKNRGGATSATTITRSDITPTITATPAVKETSRNRFGGGRRSSSALNNVIQSSSVAVQPTGNSSSRRFARPGRISPTVSLGSASSRVRPTSSGRIQPTSSVQLNSSSRRAGGFRSSSIAPRINLSSAYAGNSRYRVRPTASVTTSPSTSSITTTPNDFTEPSDITTYEVTQEPTDVNEEENPDEPITTTTENSRRRGNPLLNLRRPPLARQPGTASPVGTTRPAPISTRRNPLARTSRPSTTSTTTSTQKPKPRSFQRPSLPPIAPIGSRPRPGGANLFPPRGLLRTTQPPKAVEEEEISENDNPNDEENDFTDDPDQEGTELEEQIVEQGKPQQDTKVSPNKPLIRPFVGFRKRSKRQIDYGSRYQSRYQTQRKPKVVPQVDYYYEDETEAPPRTTSRPTNSRFRSRSQPTSAPQSNNRIRPTSASSVQNRSQFTLRDTSNQNTRNQNFRRPTTNLSSNRRAVASTRSTSRYNQYVQPSNRNTNRARTTISARRTSARTRVPKVDPYIVQNDGTITVTHHIPTETKIPVVNNGHTEYKNIITEKTSTEVLGPKQYYTSSDLNGKLVTLLSSEATAVNNNGLTEVTQFILFETPTSSIIFTPTTIRGRKTSFSHIIPSTVYDVHSTVSTNQAGLAANAPLANILLSQLLLGNVGLQQQQTINPLLSFQQQHQQQIPNTPMTEYKVRTTMYETTLTSSTSTILPLTFHGKLISTTIVETSTNVITATEFITDTIVVTPTQQANHQQLNSLLLPLLFQQQNAPQIQQSVSTKDIQLQNLLQENLEADEKQFDNIQSIRDDKQKTKEVDDYDTYDDLSIKKAPEKSKTTLKSFKKYQNDPQPKAVSAAPKTSVVTLYVSGRRPGEFSTVLSTYVVGEDSAVSKRSASYVEVIPSRLPNQDKKIEIDDLVDIYQAEASNNIDDFYLAGTNEINLESSQEQNQRLHDSETTSLESVLGDVSRYYTDNNQGQSSYFLA